MLHKKHKYDIIIFLSLLGFGISIYLAVSKYLGIAVPCDITGGCEEVLNSKYSAFLGLPFAVWGVAFFVAAILFGLLANHYTKARKFLTLMLGTGSAVALVLLFIQFFTLGKVCQYCLITDLLTIALFLFDLNIEHKL